MKDKKLNAYHIETYDGLGCYNFITQAENSKKALRVLETKSWDFRTMVKSDKDLKIIIRKV